MKLFRPGAVKKASPKKPRLKKQSSYGHRQAKQPDESWSQLGHKNSTQSEQPKGIDPRWDEVEYLIATGRKKSAKRLASIIHYQTSVDPEQEVKEYTDELKRQGEVTITTMQGKTLSF